MNINILVLFVAALYSEDTTNIVAVNVVVGLAAVHFSLIIKYHIVTYLLSGVTRNKIKLHIRTSIGWITRQQKKPKFHEFVELHDIGDRVPEAVNYHEYREPLGLWGST